jgi:hypothetical protein
MKTMTKGTKMKHKRQGYIVRFKNMVNALEFRDMNDFQHNLMEFKCVEGGITPESLKRIVIVGSEVQIDYAHEGKIKVRRLSKYNSNDMALWHDILTWNTVKITKLGK